MLRAWPILILALSLTLFSSAISSLADVAAQDVPQFVMEWGTEGSAPGEFLEPWGLEINSHGNLDVADSRNSRIQTFSSDGALLNIVGGANVEPYLHTPQTVTRNGMGQILVGDTRRIVVYDSTGVFLEERGSECVLDNPNECVGDGAGQYCSDLGGITYSPTTDRYYVSDTCNSRVQMFDGAGNFLAMWGERPTRTPPLPEYLFSFPHGLAIDDTRGFLYVADWSQSVLKFDLDGNYLARIGHRGFDLGEFQWPSDVAVDAAGRVFVVDSGMHRIQILDTAGTPLASWGSQGNEPGEFFFPRGIAIDLSGNVYVSDTGNHRIQKFSWTTPVSSKSITELKSLFR